MSILSYLKTHSVLAVTVVIVAVATAFISGRVANQKKIVVTNDSNSKHVSLVNIDLFRNDSSKISADGIVQSVNQVDLKSQISAPISSLSVSLGDLVYAGQVIAELSNADIHAQLDQAKASLSLEDVAVDAARRAAIDAAGDAYLNADEVVHTQIDPLFLNTTGTSPQLSSFIVDKTLYDDIRYIRTDLNEVFSNWKAIVDGLSIESSDAAIQGALSLSQRNIGLVRNMLDKISSGLNYTATIALPSDLVIINGWKGTVTASRTSMSNVDGSLTGSIRSLTSALVTSGAAKNSTSIAYSGVRNLEAMLNKTIIRAPMAGRIAALPLRLGELASPGQLIATVVGPGDLQIDAFASGDDIARIKKGASVMIQGTTTGVVSSVAPSVNQINKKVEVKILVNQSEQSKLVIGENVFVSIAADSEGANSADIVPYKLPIQNVKIVPGEAYIFTVDTENKVVKHPVTLTKVSGDFVEVTGSITPGMNIVTPVYEIEEGQIVTVE